jgi:hypothetical protein
MFEAKSLSNPQKVRFVIPKGQAVPLLLKDWRRKNVLKCLGFSPSDLKNHLTNKNSSR